MPVSRTLVEVVPAYTFPLAPAVPTSLLEAGPLLYATDEVAARAPNPVTRDLLTQVDASIADIELVLARLPVVPDIDPDDLLVEPPSDALYRDAYAWRRVKPKIRRGTYRAQTDDDPELWR